MNDIGHIETDALIKDTEREIKRVYLRAQTEVQAKLDNYLKAFEHKDAEKRAELAQGLITQEQYSYWRTGQICIGERWKEMVDTLATDYVNADRIAMSVVNGHTPDAYAINHNYGTFQVEEGSLVDTSYTLYDRQTVERLMRDDPELLPKARVDIPKDKRWNKRHIKDEITQGVLQGEDLRKVAKRLQKVTDMDRRAAVRNARTIMTGAQNAGRVDSYKRAERMGIGLKQTWLATLDGRTRHSHRELDGETVKVGEKFSNGCRFPGDPDGDPSEVYNCRCTLIADVEGVDTSDAERYDEKLGDMSYEEWKNERKNSFEHKEQNEEKYSVKGLTAPIRPKKSNYNSEEEYYSAKAIYDQERKEYEKKLDDSIKRGAEYKRFETQKQAIEWAKSQGITIDDDLFEKIDFRSMQEASRVLDELFEAYPEAKSFEFEDFDGTIHKTGFAIGTTDIGLLSAVDDNGRGFYFNPKYFGDYDLGLGMSLYQQTNGYNVVGDGTFGTLVRHEYGHTVQTYIESKISGEYHYYVDDWRRYYASLEDYKSAGEKFHEKMGEYKAELRSLAGLSGSSEYSMTNENELFAEGFAEFSSGAETEFAKRFGEFLRRWY